MSDNYVTPSALAPASPPVYALGIPVAPSVVPVSDLGGRSDTAAAAMDVQYLAQVCQNPAILKGNKSPGASGLLKEFLYETGYAYQVVREVFADGGAHQAGNAIDVTSDDMGSLCRFLRQIPKLFVTAVYTDPDGYTAESLYISNGAVVGSLSFSEPVGQLHLATTFQAFSAALKLKAVQTALATAAQGQFTNRDVYAVAVNDIGGQTGEPMVAFW